jgi:hypothetical protein
MASALKRLLAADLRLLPLGTKKGFRNLQGRFDIKTAGQFDAETIGVCCKSMCLPQPPIPPGAVLSYFAMRVVRAGGQILATTQGEFALRYERELKDHAVALVHARAGHLPKPAGFRSSTNWPDTVRTASRKIASNGFAVRRVSSSAVRRISAMWAPVNP